MTRSPVLFLHVDPFAEIVFACGLDGTSDGNRPLTLEQDGPGGPGDKTDSYRTECGDLFASVVSARTGFSVPVISVLNTPGSHSSGNRVGLCFCLSYPRIVNLGKNLMQTYSIACQILWSVLIYCVVWTDECVVALCSPQDCFTGTYYN